MGIRLARLFLLTVFGSLCLGVWTGSASLPPFQITIESGSPYFFPASATVAAGAPIQWDNPTASHHTVTHDGCQLDGSCAFDSGSMAPNESFSLPGLPPGRYAYHCTLHPIMRGVLTVVEQAPLPSST
ncbi:MAG: hypothetical protein ACKOCD_00645 [Nitrospiraceae bacterium]